MGRKIPAKKHRGVKDPLKQQAERFKRIKNKINAPPKDPDEQPVPRSLTELFAFQHKDNASKKKVKLSKPRVSADVSGVGKNPVSRLQRLPGESGRGFSLRISSAIRALNDTSALDYPQDVDETDAKGERMAEHRERRERKRRRAARAVTADEPGAEHSLSRKQRLTAKRKAKKLKAIESETEKCEVVYERVGLGEVAHAPPALRPPRHATADSAPRPGARDLLLTKLLSSGSGNTDGAVAPAFSAKRGGFPAAELLRRERARLDAVTAYRAIKATQNKTKSS